MRTLTEIQPRTPVGDTVTPGDAACVFKITQAGSYYLTASIGPVPAGKHGIMITTGDVSIDLNGFEILGNGVGNGSLDGINASAGAANITVRNGTVRNMNGAGLNFSVATDSRVENIQAISNGGAGITTADRCSIFASATRQNGGHGIVTTSNCYLERCNSSNNATSGIYTEGGCTIEGCGASGNGVSGIIVGLGSTTSNSAANGNTVSGFASNFGVAFSNCAANGNGADGFNLTGSGAVTGCAANANAGSGFLAYYGTVLKNCSASRNKGSGISAFLNVSILDCFALENMHDGILANGACLIRGNHCDANGISGGNAAGINITGSANRIEANNCIQAQRGIQVAGNHNVIIKNTCSTNVTNWSVSAGNVILVVAATPATSINGDAGGTPPGSTDPNVNLTY